MCVAVEEGVALRCGGVMVMLRLLLLPLLVGGPAVAVAGSPPDAHGGPADDWLIRCYRNHSAVAHAVGLPRSLPVLVQLVHKVERHPSAALDLRTVAFTLLHKLRLDGVEWQPGVQETATVVPVRESGRQNARYRVLLGRLLAGSADLFPHDSLTDPELCTLHDMLSLRVDPWERGGEADECPLRPELHLQPLNSGLSRCPAEGGAVHTRWGSVAPGTLVAALAAALQPQQVHVGRLVAAGAAADPGRRAELRRLQELPETDTVSNVWAATLAGDLAEAAVLQGPLGDGIQLGPGGRWDDPLLPQLRMLVPPPLPPLWDLTDAELLGGVDGLVLAGRVAQWTGRRPRLRLSQLLDMYYSRRGVAFDPSFRACERADRLASVLDYDQLQSETINMALVLKLETPGLPPMNATPYSIAAVEAFRRHLPNVLAAHACVEADGEEALPPRAQVYAALDHTWRGRDAARFLAELGEQLGVSPHGSALAVLDGSSGEMLSELSSSYLQLMETAHLTHIEPGPLSAATSLMAALGDLNARETAALEAGAVGGPGSAVLLLACGSPLGDAERETAQLVLHEMRDSQPETHVLVVTTSGAEGWQRLLHEVPGPSAVLVTPDGCDPTAVSTLAARALRQVPARLRGPRCQESRLDAAPVPREFEDYVTPGEPLLYRVDPQYLAGVAEITIKLRGAGYGTLAVCWARDPAAFEAEAVAASTAGDCSELHGHDELKVVRRAPCTNRESCQPLYMRLDVVASDGRCAEDDCRFPDQVRFSLTVEGLRCFHAPGQGGDVGSGCGVIAVSTLAVTAAAALGLTVNCLRAVS